MEKGPAKNRISNKLILLVISFIIGFAFYNLYNESSRITLSIWIVIVVLGSLIALFMGNSITKSLKSIVGITRETLKKNFDKFTIQDQRVIQQPASVHETTVAMDKLKTPFEHMDSLIKGDAEKSKKILHIPEERNLLSKEMMLNLNNHQLATYQNILQQVKDQAALQEELKKAYTQLEISNKEQEKLLYNIMPLSVAQELIAYGAVKPKRYEEVTVLFLDFVGFTLSATTIPPHQLLTSLEFYFEAFDDIIEKHQIEKIKTIGDGYMCAGGVPFSNETHALNALEASWEILEFVKNNFDKVREAYKVSWNIRIGINTGPVVAGVIGKKRLAYDIWGDTVNIASRMESYGEDGKINVSKQTYEKIKSRVKARSKGSVLVSDKPEANLYIDMYVVDELT